MNNKTDNNLNNTAFFNNFYNLSKNNNFSSKNSSLPNFPNDNQSSSKSNSNFDSIFDDIKNSSSNSNINNNSDFFSNIDMDTIFKIKSIMNKMNNIDNSPRTNLLLSLKPYLKSNKKEKIDQYIKLFNLTELFQNFNDGGEK